MVTVVTSSLLTQLQLKMKKWTKMMMEALASSTALRNQVSMICPRWVVGVVAVGARCVSAPSRRTLTRLESSRVRISATRTTGDVVDAEVIEVEAPPAITTTTGAVGVAEAEAVATEGKMMTAIIEAVDNEEVDTKGTVEAEATIKEVETVAGVATRTTVGSTEAAPTIKAIVQLVIHLLMLSGSSNSSNSDRIVLI